MTLALSSVAGCAAGSIGLGTWALAGGTDWGGQAPAPQLISAALDVGVRVFDTAPIYGDGEGERLLGAAIKDRRKEALVFSKCGICLRSGRPDHDLRPQTIQAQCESSLQKLQTDYIDIYFIHWPDPHVPLADALGALQRLQEQGKIRAVGVCNLSAEQLQQAVSLTTLSAVQYAVSLLQPLPAAVQKICRQAGISVWGYGGLAGGILSGKYKTVPNFRRCDARRYFYKHYYGDSFHAAQTVAQRVKKLAAVKQVPPSAVALAWALGPGGADGILAGARHTVQLMQNLQAEKLSISASEGAFLNGTAKPY